jgi:hypothetical protein
VNDFWRLPFRNLTLKLAAAFLATALFLHVRREAERVDELRVPLVVEGAVATVGGPPIPDSVGVRLTARARDLDRLDAALLRVHVRVDGLPTGSTLLRPLSSADLLLPAGFRPAETEILAGPPLLLRVEARDAPRGLGN